VLKTQCFTQRNRGLRLYWNLQFHAQTEAASTETNAEADGIVSFRLTSDSFNAFL
jgi:hypothetical protein